ncbi:hypothetical protein CNO14_05355 (plasmid) [Borrelia miyamotoi]|uniref:Lipoprotein n=2 Tax=Borrelia miyamotoi TaxID=47466 RepID=A0AAQ3HFV7_9SPIR|nr:hypothetical protein [Borrelia miyamotoi]AHH05677.1 Hypothetical protein BOM_1134 [Borrelia miyamotoi FR64b]ATQ15403.1 hypothetical protein CNO14_05355 [Borrelia miyamotoi]ATQ16546.1 hypothetical protein CNO13_05110 [Borrelia miyamotoi]ATQ17714.1 hypothetical protein CNO12_05260 [Borrelia miyamotoi]ATQ18964.1 hypothetical protein CNO11_05275 [Borrelia miyamotoi]
MKILKNTFMTLLFIIFSCSHSLFTKPSSGLIKDYAEVIFDSQKYYYMEELPIKFNLELEFLDSQSETTSKTYHQLLGKQLVSTNKSFYRNSSSQINNLSIGKISILIDSVCINKLNIKTLRELNDHLKNRNLNALNIRFVFDSSIGELVSSSNKSLFGTQCIVFSYNELIIFNNSIKNKENSINLTLNIANKNLQSNIYNLSPKEYNSYIETENKFVNNKDKGNFHFKIKGNIAIFSSFLEETLKKIKEGRL